MELRRLSDIFLRTVRQPNAYEILLSRPHFGAALRRERLRADRCLSSFSLLTVADGKRAATDETMPAIARVLEFRVRESDIAGWFSEGVIGIILPETAAAGAWKLAEDLQTAFELQQIS